MVAIKRATTIRCVRVGLLEPQGKPSGFFGASSVSLKGREFPSSNFRPSVYRDGAREVGPACFSKTRFSPVSIGTLTRTAVLEPACPRTQLRTPGSSLRDHPHA